MSMSVRFGLAVRSWAADASSAPTGGILHIEVGFLAVGNLLRARRHSDDDDSGGLCAYTAGLVVRLQAVYLRITSTRPTSKERQRFAHSAESLFRRLRGRSQVQ